MPTFWTGDAMPAPAGVTFLGPMTVARNSDGRLELFVLASDPAGLFIPGDIYHASQIEATDGPPEFVEVGTGPTIDGLTVPLLTLASGDVWSDLATPLWTSLGRPPNGGVLINDQPLRGGSGGLVLPQPVLAATTDSLGFLMLCVVGADGSLYSRSQSVSGDSSSWGPWTGSQPPQTTLSANLAVVISGQAVFAFLIGASGNTNEVIYYVQDGSGVPWAGPFPLGSPVPSEYTMALTASVDAKAGILLIVTTYYQPPSGQNVATLFSNYLPQAVSSIWSGWVPMPQISSALPAIQLQTSWVGSGMYLFFSVWPGATIYYVSYELRPAASSLPTWTPAYATLVTGAAGIVSWAADAWDVPIPGSEEPLTTAVFFVDPQSGVWMAGFEFSRRIGANSSHLVPSAPVQIDTGQWSNGQQPGLLWPQQAAIRNASGLWQVFCMQSGQCYRWRQPAPS